MIKKKTGMGKRIFFCVLAAVLVVGTGILLVRTDWRFTLVQQISAPFRQIEFQKLSLSPESLESVQAEEFLNREGIRKDDSLVLINSAHPVGDSRYSLEEYKDSGLLMNSCVVEDYAQLSAAVLENTGERLYVNNSYRSREEQVEVFEQEGSDVSAKPGESEHETGLAMDVYVYGLAGPGFLKSKAAQLIATEGWKYGFVIRYPQFKTSKTGISYEPWHIRYVGKPHAKILYYKNWCLEEYYEHLEVGRYYQSENYLITRQPEDTTLKIPLGLTEVTVSKDNMGNLVITGVYEQAEMDE